MVTFVAKDETFRFVIRYTLQGAALFVLFSYILSEQSSLANKVLTTSPMIWIGLVSYSLYLCHFAIFRTLQLHTSLGTFAIGASGLVIAFGYAYLMRRFVELPILGWRKRHAARQRTRVAELAANRELTSPFIGAVCEPETGASSAP